MLQTDPNLIVQQVNDANDVLVTNYNWQISEVCVLADVLTLSPDFSSNIDQLLLSGSSIQIPYKLMATQYQSLPPGGFSTITTIAQFAFSRVNCVLAHFTANPPAAGFPIGKIRPYLNNGDTFALPANAKSFNYYAGVYGPIPMAFGDLFSASLHIGGLIVPSQPQQGASTQFYYLRQCIDETFDTQTLNIGSLAEYGTFSFILGFNLQKVNGMDASFSGVSLRAGETVTLQCTNLPSGDDLPNFGIGQITGVYLTFFADSILNISGSGCTIQQ
jgi:hypothetical protein